MRTADLDDARRSGPTSISMDAGEVLRTALADHVAFVPGTAFFADGSGANTMRLNFTNASIERIDEGIRRLGRVLHRLMVSP
jgi:2-aminoadipate transaminase